MNKAYKIIWNKARECYVVVAEFAKTRSKSSSRSLSLLMTTGVLLSLLTSSAFASGTATVTGTSGTDDLVTIQGGTDISVTQNNGVITIGAVYDPTLETLRKYIKFNADYDSGTSLPSVAANSANSFVWGKNAAVSVYSLAEKSEKNIAIGAGSKIFAGNMGNPSKGTGSNTAIGADSSVGSSNNIYGTYDTVVGAGAKAYGGSNVVVGNSQAGLNQQIGTKSDGTKIWANVDNAVVVGSGAAAYSDKATAVGGAAIAGKKPTRTDYTDRSQAENAKITYTTAVGYGAHAFGMNSTAVGAQTVATGQQNISLGSGSEARKDNTMSVGFHAIGGAADATAIGHDAVVFGDGGLAIGHLVFTGMPALEGYRNNNLDESYIASPEGMRIAGDSKIYFRTEDGTVLKYEVKIGQNGEEDGKYYKVKAVQTGNSWKFVKVNAAGEEVSDTSPDAVQYLAKESMTKDTRTSSKVNHIDYFYIAGQESSSKIYPTDEGVAIGTYVSTEGSRAMAIGMSSTAHDANNTALGLYSNTFGKDATAIGHASLSGARGLIETNVNTGEHTVSYQVTKKGISERTTIDGTVVSYDKNFAYEFSDGTNTLKVQNGKIVAVGGTAYTQTGIKLASDNTAVYRDTETGYLYYTKSGAKHLVKPDEDVIINGSGDTLTVSAGKMMLSNGGLAIGSYTHAEGDKSVAFGNASGASGRNSVAIGKFANAYGEGSIAFGSDAVAGAEVTTNVDGHKVLAITNKTGQPVMEDGKHVSGAVAFGNYAHATANNSLAFGTDAEATAKNSVAIGSGSVSDVEDTVSIGSADKTRTIVHVTAGVDDTDAVNVSQLKSKANKNLDNIDSDGKAVIVGLTDVVSGDSIVTVTPNTNADGKKTYTITAAISGDGVVEEGNTGLVTGGVVYDAMMAESRPASNGNYITTDNTAGANLTVLDNQVKTNADDIANLDTVKANTGLDNITNDGKTVVRTLAQEAVKMVDGTNTTVTEGIDGVVKTYAVNVTTNGQVASGNTGIVTGGTVYDAIQNYDATNGMHYVSINSSVTSAGSNYANDGATGQRAIAIGESATATAKDAVAIGYKAKAEGEGAFAFGEGATSNGKGTVAFTGGNEASGTYSMAWGMNNVAGISADGTETFTGATAFGIGTEARNDGATAMGNWTIAEGQNSVAMGNGARTREDAKASLAMGQDTQAAGTGSFAGGTDSIAGGFNSFAHGYTAEAVGSTAIAMGDDAKAVGDESVALGYNSKAYGNYSVAILGGRTGDGSFDYDDDTGEYDVDVTDNAIGAFAAGFGSVAMKDYTVAIGRHATVENDQSIALGEDATVVADSSVALGYGSVATEENVISVGHKQGDAKYGGGTYDTALNRKIVNVASGVNDTDAVNVKQLTEAVGDKANKDLDNITDAGHSVIKSDAKSVINVVGADKATVTKADVNGVDTYTVSVKADGAVADGNENIVNGGTVYNALQAQKNEMNTALDGKANIGLDNITDNGKTVVRSLAQEAVKVVNGTNTTVTEGADGNAKTYAVNVTTNGTVTSGDTGVVTGGTVYDAIQDIVTGDMTGKANISLDNVNDAGHAVIKTDAKSAINVVGNDDITVAKTDVNGVDTYTVSVKTDGQVTQNNENVVSGGTVYEALQAERETTNTSLEGKANVALDNITDDGHNVIKEDAKSAINVKGGTYATVDKTNVDGVDTYTVNVANDGSVAEGNNKLVTGGTVYEALNNVISDTNTALDGKANTTLNNITDDGKTVVRNLAQEAVKVVNGTNTTVVEGTDGDAKTYAVNVNVNGEIVSGNTDAVSGGTVYDYITELEAGTNASLLNKANVDASNVGKNATTDNSEAWGEALGTGTVADGDGKLVTGGTVHEALMSETRPSADGNYIKATDTAGQNLTALDSQVKTNADAIATNATDISNLKDLSNITETGKTVVKNLAKGSVNVVGADKAVVTKSDVEGVDTYTVSVKADGVVAQGNENIVTGGTVYDAITTATDTMNDALNSKANVSLDNVTEAGHNVIKSDAKSAINVVGKDDVTVTKSDVEGVDTYTVSVVKNGTVTSGNEGIVTGDTVYNALQEQKTATDTALEGKANVALDNITDDGKTVVRNLAKESVKVINGTNTTVTEGTDGDAKTYAVNVVANGVIEVDNNGLVTGGTVYNETRVTSNGNYISTSNSVKDNLVALDNAIKGVSDVADATQNELDNKANKDASNVTDATAWGNAIGTGTVNSNDGKLVTGKTVATETRVANNGNYVLADNTAGQNIAELDRVLKETRDIAEVASSSGTDANAVHYDSADKSVVTLAGTDGTLLTNLKDGEISETSKDAVTGKQLHDTNTKVEQVTSRVDTLETTVGTMNDGNYISKDASVGENLSTLDNQIKSVSDGLDSVTTNIGELRTDLDGKLNTNMDNLTEDGRTAISDIAKESVKVEGSGLAKVTSAEQGNVKVYTVDVKADGKVASGDTGLVTGDTIYNETRPADGNYVKNGNTTAENLSAIDTQVKTNTDDISNINQTVNNMGSRINKLGTRINKVGAGAAALAALHPQDFDPGTKWDIAAGFGNYRDANAVAIGAFYRPNDDTMFSIGTNFGNGENMVNAGVSVRLGHASEYAGLSRAELVKKIESQDKTLEKQQAEIDELKAIVAKLASK